MTTPTRSAPTYIDGIYAPVDDELAVGDLAVEGELPAELRGMFVQNSPNPRLRPEGAYHWFDGDGMVHGVAIGDGRAGYHNRWVRTEAFAQEEAAGRPLWRGILEPMREDRLEKDTANTDLVWHGGRLLALWWLGGVPYELATPSLQTVGPIDFGGTLRGGVASHPKVDPVTGELIFFDFDVQRAPYLRVGVASPDGRVTHATEIDIPGPRLFHDIAITERHTILLDLPMTWDAERLAAGKRRVRFERDTPSRFGILPRHGAGGDVRWFEAPACYIYHTINAWEETTASGGTAIVMTGCRIDDPIPRTPPDAEPTTPRLAFLRLEPYLTRWRFDLETGAVTEERLDDVPTEFPRTNDDRLGRPTRWGYAPRIAAEPTLLFDGVLKYDLDDGRATRHVWGEERFGSEVVFVARPGAADEDDGWLLSLVLDRAADRSELVVLDARDLAAAPLARVRLPRRVPVGFHAHWVPGSGLA